MYVTERRLDRSEEEKGGISILLKGAARYKLMFTESEAARHKM